MSEEVVHPAWRTPGTAAKALIMVAALGLAAFLLHRTFRGYDAHEILASIAALSPLRLALVGAFALASYLCLAGFDALALRYAGASLSLPRIVLTSMTSLSIGHSVGFAALSSGAIRYRFYSRFGLGGEQIAKVILLCATTVGLGLATLLSLGLLLRPEVARQIGGLAPAAIPLFGLLAGALPVAYLVLAATVRTKVPLLSWSMAMPSLPIALGQVAIGSLNFAMLVACLFTALPASSSVGYLDVLAAFTLANAAGMVTHVPGGLGVIEAVMLFLLPGAETVAALIVFRAAYFLVPFVLGIAALSIAEIAARRRRAVQDEVVGAGLARVRR